jgi:2-polyprenyl-6-methoxyphenol hydroxylase-like FAD-dependent oxidoreductase
MAAGRVVLIGDAAHEISPIGGQGMNLGWLDAQALSPVILTALSGGRKDRMDREFEEFEAGRRQAALLARRQSEINMMLGRPLPGPLLALRNLAISAAAGTPAVNSWLARRFTMQSPAPGRLPGSSYR